MKNSILFLLLTFFSVIAKAQDGKQIPSQHSGSKTSNSNTDINKRLDELEKRTQEAERRAAEAEKKATEAEKRAIEAEKKSAAKPTVTNTATQTTKSTSVDSKPITTTTTTNVSPSSGDVKYVKTPDGKMIKMVNGKPVKDEANTANPSTVTSTSSTNTSSSSGDVKYIKTPDGKMIKMVNGKPVKDDSSVASPSPTTTNTATTPVKEPKLIAPDIGKVTKQPASKSNQQSMTSPVSPDTDQAKTQVVPTPTVTTRKVDTSRPSILTISTDADCSLKINGKELALLKAGTPITYKAHWGENSIDAFLSDKSDKVMERVFVDADQFKYAIRFIRADKLMKFISENKIDMVAEVIKNNPDVINPKDEFEFSPLSLASEKGKTEIVKLMLEKGADVKLPANNQCLLHACMNGNTDIAKMLIDKGMNVNQKFENGWTVLHHATQNGKMNVITMLLENGVDVTAKTDKGETAKDIAYENGMIDLGRMLVK